MRILERFDKFAYDKQKQEEKKINDKALELVDTLEHVLHIDFEKFPDAKKYMYQIFTRKHLFYIDIHAIPPSDAVRFYYSKPNGEIVNETFKVKDVDYGILKKIRNIYFDWVKYKEMDEMGV